MRLINWSRATFKSFQMNFNINRNFQMIYLIPKRYQFYTTIRILGTVFFLRFVNNIQVKRNCTPLLFNRNKNSTEKELVDSKNCFFKKATKEIKQFVRPSNYQKINREDNDILLRTGRIPEISNMSSTLDFLMSWKIWAQKHFVFDYFTNTHHQPTVPLTKFIGTQK